MPSFVLDFRLREFPSSAITNLLNFGVNKSNCCYCLTKSVLVGQEWNMEFSISLQKTPYLHFLIVGS